jgi:hypothetical protein
MKINSKAIALAAIIITSFFINKSSARQTISCFDFIYQKDCFIDHFNIESAAKFTKSNIISDSPELNAKENIYVYPNPAKNKVWIKIENKSANLEEAQVYSPFGYNIFNVKLDNSLHSVDLSTYPNGIYIFIVDNRLFRIEKV